MPRAILTGEEPRLNGGSRRAQRAIVVARSHRDALPESHRDIALRQPEKAFGQNPRIDKNIIVAAGRPTCRRGSRRGVDGEHTVVGCEGWHCVNQALAFPGKPVRSLRRPSECSRVDLSGRSGYVRQAERGPEHRCSHWALEHDSETRIDQYCPRAEREHESASICAVASRCTPEPPD